jgi:hypothetical protein
MMVMLSIYLRIEESRDHSDWNTSVHLKSNNESKEGNSDIEAFPSQSLLFNRKPNIEWIQWNSNSFYTYRLKPLNWN